MTVVDAVVQCSVMRSCGVTWCIGVAWRGVAWRGVAWFCVVWRRAVHSAWCGDVRCGTRTTCDSGHSSSYQ